MGKLQIGFNGLDSADPDPLPIKVNEKVQVKVKDDCSVYFDKIFKDDPDCLRGSRTWTQINGHADEVFYVIKKHGSVRPNTIENTHSIKIGSRLPRKSKKAKTARKNAKANRTTAKKAKPKKEKK